MKKISLYVSKEKEPEFMITLSRLQKKKKTRVLLLWVKYICMSKFNQNFKSYGCFEMFDSPLRLNGTYSGQKVLYKSL